MQARIGTQVLQRIVILITVLYSGWLGAWLMIAAKRTLLKNLGAIIIILLMIQIGLNGLHVAWNLPLLVAVLHTAVAALLLLTVVSLNYCLTKPALE